MEIQEFVATMQQIAREREALNAAYEVLELRAADEAEETRRTGIAKPPAQLLPELLELARQLGNFVTIEREHGDKLYELLVEVLRRLAQAYGLELPADWPDSGAADPS